MCGIIGGLHSGSIDAQALGLAMLERVRHRGPDAGYLHLEEGLFLGVRRLAIINPKQGPQPVFNESRRVLAVLNGEIYNHRELREELGRAGHHVADGSDAEVFPHAYEQWGLDFPKHLNGEFAIALWDSDDAAIDAHSRSSRHQTVVLHADYAGGSSSHPKSRPF